MIDAILKAVSLLFVFAAVTYCSVETERSNSAEKIKCMELRGEWSIGWGGICSFQ